MAFIGTGVTMRKTVWFGFFILCANLSSADHEFKIHARFDFEDPDQENYRQEIYYGTPASGGLKPNLSVKAWPRGKESYRLKLHLGENGYGGSGGSLEVSPNSDTQVLLLLGFGSIPSHSDLKAAFCLRVPADWTQMLQVYIHNPIMKKNIGTIIYKIPAEET